MVSNPSFRGDLWVDKGLPIGNFSRDPQIMAPASYKLPITFLYFKGFFWKRYGSSMGMGFPCPWGSLEFPLITLHETNSDFAPQKSHPSQRKRKAGSSSSRIIFEGLYICWFWGMGTPRKTNMEPENLNFWVPCYFFGGGSILVCQANYIYICYPSRFIRCIKL